MEPSITDWIQAIGVLLGVPIVIYGIVKLFFKDKEKERKITALENLSKHQSEIVDQMHLQFEQLIEQTSQLQYQGHLMYEANKLLEKQIDLQSSIHIEEKEYKEKKLEIEKAKRISKIKPYFIIEPIMFHLKEFKFKVINKGNDALNVELKELKFEEAFINRLSKIDRVEKTEEIVFVGRSRGEKHGKKVEFETDLIFEDVEGNKYFQTIKKNANGNLKIGEPKLYKG